jgi:hypothetical protein
MRSSALSWLIALTLLVVGVAALVSVPAFPMRLLIACATVFLVDAIGGRWFGYFSLLSLGAGIVGDTNNTWLTMLPLLVGSAWAALFLRHAEPGWFGVVLGVVGFALPAVVLHFARSRLDPNLVLPSGTQYLTLHGGVGAGTLLIASLVGFWWRSRQEHAPHRRITRARRSSPATRARP